MSLMRVEDMAVELRARPVLRGVSLEIAAGECVALIGPNGAGKSTLIRAALGLLPFRGHSSLAALSPEARRRQVAFLPQNREIAWPVSVETIVGLGRSGSAPEDLRAVEAAMARTEITALRGRRADRLSGGEQARVLLARALAMETPLLLADEPVAGLDPAHQLAAMENFASLAAEGRGVLISMHDLGLAARWCSRAVLLDQGVIRADGPPREVLSADNLAAIYNVEAHIADGPLGMVLQPIARLRKTVSG